MTRGQLIRAVIIGLSSMVLAVHWAGGGMEPPTAEPVVEQPNLIMAEAYCITKNAAEIMVRSVEDYGKDGYRASVLLPSVACYDAGLNRFDIPIVVALKKQMFSVGNQKFGVDIWEAEMADGRTVYVCFPVFGRPV